MKNYELAVGIDVSKKTLDVLSTTTVNIGCSIIQDPVTYLW